MARVSIRGILGITVVALLMLGIGIAASQTANEAKVKQIFQAHCATCHNGQVAPSFDQLVKIIKGWAKKYKTLDEAVAHEYKQASSYDQLMQQMRSYAGGLSSQDYKLIYDFFKQVFEEAKAGTTATTTTKTTTITKTATSTMTTATTTTTKTTTTTTTSITTTSTTTTMPKKAYTTPPPTITDTAWKTVKPYSSHLHKVIKTGLYAGIAALIIGIIIAAIALARRH